MLEAVWPYHCLMIVLSVLLGYEAVALGQAWPTGCKPAHEPVAVEQSAELAGLHQPTQDSAQEPQQQRRAATDQGYKLDRRAEGDDKPAAREPQHPQCNG